MTTLVIADPHPATDGHFPGNPIVPGAVLLDEVLAALGIEAPRLRDAKFLHPVRPGDTLNLTASGNRFEVALKDGPPVLRGSLAAS